MEPSPEDVILEEEIDPNYEPTEEELLEYATWLGMDLTNHKNLLWIAKEALIAPLPSDWKPCLTEEDEIYYFNFTTGRSIWDHPCDEHYRQVYKEEAEKLNKQQNNQTTAGSSPSPKDQQMQSNTKSSQRGSVGDLSSQNSMETVSARDITVGSRSLKSPSFRRDPSSSSNNNHLTRSLPPPQVVGHPAVLNLKGGSFDSMLRLYAASLANTGGSMPLADFLKMQGSVQTKTNDNSTSCVSTSSFDEHFCATMNEEKRMWLQGDDRRAFEKKISQIKERIEKKLVDEERIVLQQERVEMLERVCKQVQEEESHVLDSLRREIMERMERNIREETQALLAKRRKEIADQVESEMQAEKLQLVESRRLRQRSEEGMPSDNDIRAMVAGECSKVKEVEAPSLEGTNTSEKEKLKSKRDDMMSVKQEEQDEDGSFKNKKENEDFFMRRNGRRGPQDMQLPVRMTPRLLTEDGDDEGEGRMKDSLQKMEAEERRFEKSFHVQDSRTSLMLKLEVSLKVGTSND